MKGQAGELFIVRLLRCRTLLRWWLLIAAAENDAERYDGNRACRLLFVHKRSDWGYRVIARSQREGFDGIVGECFSWRSDREASPTRRQILCAGVLCQHWQN
jgi:hypothetical protein